MRFPKKTEKQNAAKALKYKAFENVCLFEEIEQTGPKVRIKIGVYRFNDGHYLDLRKWYLRKELNDWAPTRKGLSIKLFELDWIVETLGILRRKSIDSGTGREKDFLEKGVNLGTEEENKQIE